MTTTTREELLELLTSILPPDPLAHDYFCPKCGGTDHLESCTFRRATIVCAAHDAGWLEFEDDANEPTRPGQRVRCVEPKEGVFAEGDEFTVAELCGGDVKFEGRDDWWPKWWFEVVPGPPPEGEQGPTDAELLKEAVRLLEAMVAEWYRDERGECVYCGRLRGHKSDCAWQNCGDFIRRYKDRANAE